jgi:hypothetical protein
VSDQRARHSMLRLISLIETEHESQALHVKPTEPFLCDLVGGMEWPAPVERFSKPTEGERLVKPVKDVRTKDPLFHLRGPQVRVRRSCPLMRFVFLALGTAGFLPALSGGFLTAQPVERASATRVAISKLAELDLGERYDLVGTKGQVTDEAERILAYAFELRPRGLIIVSGDRSLPPVVAYSLENALHAATEHENPLLSLVGSDLGKRLANRHGIQDLWREANRRAWDG